MFAHIDSRMPYAFSVARIARKTITVSATGTLMNSASQSPANPTASAPTETIPAASMQ